MTAGLYFENMLKLFVGSAIIHLRFPTNVPLQNPYVFSQPCFFLLNFLFVSLSSPPRPKRYLHPFHPIAPRRGVENMIRFFRVKLIFRKCVEAILWRLASLNLERDAYVYFELVFVSEFVYVNSSSY